MYRKGWILASVGCGTFMATLDSSIVNIALPTLTKALGAELPTVKWVIVVYLLCITCLLLPFGRLSDQLGRKRTYQAGYSLFSVASALCALAPSFSVLLAGRALQGAGAALLMSNGPAIVTATYPQGARGRALGILGMVVSAGLLSGPGLGGLLLSHFGWKSIFWVNVPIGILGIALVQRYLPSDLVQKPSRILEFDWAGSIIQVFLLLGFIILVDPPFISLRDALVFPVSRGVIGVVTLAFLAAFIKIEVDAESPVFDFSLLAHRNFWTSNLASFLTFTAFSSVTLLMPFFLQEVLAMNPSRAGAFMTAIPLVVFVVAPFSGRLSDRRGARAISALGALIGAAALFGMGGAFGTGIHAQVSDVWLVLGLGAIGLSTGLFQSPNNSAVMSSVPHDKLGAASALIATLRNLGLVTGTGLATALFTWRMELQPNLESAIRLVFIVAAFIAALAAVAAFGKLDLKQQD